MQINVNDQNNIFAKIRASQHQAVALAPTNHDLQGMEKTDETGKKRDVNAISPAAKAKSRIEFLQKQKEKLGEKRQELINNTVAKGKDLKTIKDQLKFYDEQMKTIDGQISETLAKQTEEMLQKQKEAQEKKSENGDGEEITREELQAEAMGSVAAQHQSLQQMQKSRITKAEFDGELKRQEIFRDNDIQQMSIPDSAVTKIIQKKDEKIIAMKQKSAAMASNIAKSQSAVTKEINLDNEKTAHAEITPTEQPDTSAKPDELSQENPTETEKTEE